MADHHDIDIGMRGGAALDGAGDTHHHVGEARRRAGGGGAGGDPEFLVAVGVARLELGIGLALPVAEILLGDIALDPRPAAPVMPQAVCSTSRVRRARRSWLDIQIGCSGRRTATRAINSWSPQSASRSS